jgi:hypothetical protein
MTSNSDARVIARGWDGPWYRVRTDSFEVSYLPDASEDLDSMANVDAEVRLADGSRWSATIVTVAQVEHLMTQRWSVSGESLGGRYFWCPDGLIVRDPGIDSMTHVLAGLLESGEFAQILQRLDD